MNLQLTQKEAEVLKEELQRTMKRLETEISQTDSRDYRDMLNEQKAILENILNRFAEIHVA